jgi:hypothetical protein
MSESFTDPSLLLMPMAVPFVVPGTQSFFDPALMLFPYAKPPVVVTGVTGPRIFRRASFTPRVFRRKIDG